MSYIERKSYIDLIRKIGSPFIDQIWSNINLKNKDKIEMLSNELTIQKKQSTLITKRIEQTVYIYINSKIF